MDTEADASDTSLASVGASSSSSVPARRRGRPKSSAAKKGAKKIGLGIGIAGELPIPAERSPPPSLPFEEAPGTSGAAAAAATTAASTSAAAATIAATTAAATAATTAAAATCPATGIVAAGYSAIIAEMSAIRMAVNEAVLKGLMPTEASIGILVATNRYDELVMALAGEKVRLEERARMPPPPRPAAAAHTGTTAVTTAAYATAFPGLPAPSAVAAPIPRPRDTWSALIRSKNPEETSKELVERVKKTVVPALGVRVHEVRELKSGGAIIRTPSVSELRKVVASSKFAEAGLVVKKRPETKPQVVVYDVDTSITPEEFMEELFAKNLEETMTAAEFKKSVHLGSKPWSVTDGATINVTLEVDTKAQEALHECVYIKWFRCRCRSLVRTYACHRCAGFDHKVSQCRLKENVCHRCGQNGHNVARCPNPVDCRNCRLKGYPAAHSMLSAACPIYAAVLARVQARH